MSHYQVALTLKSRNEKTGPIPVSTTSRETCALACPLFGAGCYADGGPLGMYWRKVTQGEFGSDWGAFVGQIAALPEGQLWRHNQAGDLPGDGAEIDAGALAALVAANAGRRGFTYTHHDVLENAANRAAVAAANAGGFTVNLSGNNPAHADALAETGAGPVVVVMPSAVEGVYETDKRGTVSWIKGRPETLATPAGRKVVICPATYRDDTSCADCGLCARERPAIVGFPAHGASKKKASAVASGGARRFALTRNGAAVA
jgi:hypothetical protein